MNSNGDRSDCRLMPARGPKLARMRPAGVPALDIDRALGAAWRIGGRLHASHRRFVSRLSEIPNIVNMPLTHPGIEEVRQICLWEINHAVEQGLTTDGAVDVLDSLADDLDSRVAETIDYFDRSRVQGVFDGVRQAFMSVNRVAIPSGAALVSFHGLDTHGFGKDGKVIRRPIFHGDVGEKAGRLVWATEPKNLHASKQAAVSAAREWMEKATERLSREAPEETDNHSIEPIEEIGPRKTF